MTTSKNDLSYAAINRSIKTLDLSSMEQMESAAIGGSFVVDLDRLVQVYTAVKPLISVLTTIPLIPKAWRVALALFNKSLEAVTAAVPAFKAGKDL